MKQNTVRVPPRLKEIFSALGRGQRQFISDNGSENEQTLFRALDVYEDDYNEYLIQLGFQVNRGNGFFYLSGQEDSSQVTSKMERQLEWILMLNLLTTALDGFGPGYRFRASDLETKCNVNADLGERLKKYSKTGANSTLSEHVDSVLGIFLRAGFIDKQSSYARSFVVLSSINYLREIIDKLEIKD